APAALGATLRPHRRRAWEHPAPVNKPTPAAKPTPTPVVPPTPPPPAPLPAPPVNSTAHIGAAARSFLDTQARILVFGDQLPGQMTDAPWHFAGTPSAGSQNALTSLPRHMRRRPPTYLLLHNL